jgi:hypothetical protein
MERLDLDGLDETTFEEFCFGLLNELGFTNVDWRKGTGLSASPADSGRDIEAELDRSDIDGSHHTEKWFIDAKHYKKGVPPAALQNLLAWANAERPSVALVIASNFLSNGAKDYLRDYEQNNRPPFRIKVWERPTLERLADGRDAFLARYLTAPIRTEAEILAAEDEMYERRWLDRHRMLVHVHQAGERKIFSSDELLEQAESAARKIEARYGPDSLGPYSDYEWGVLAGKHSALRWVLGDEWDMLDT